MSVNISLALWIFDVFKAHQVSDFKELMTKNNIRMRYRYVPAGCTSELQQLDLSGNDEVKKYIKTSFKMVCSTSSIRTGKWKIFGSNSNWLKTVDFKALTCRVASISFWQHQIRNYQVRVAKIGHLRSVVAVDFLTVYKLCLFV